VKGLTKMNTVKSLIGFCVCLVLLAGCAASQKSATKKAEPEQVKEVRLAGVSRQRAIEVSEQVLRDFNFSIAKEDPNTGYILTRPLAGGQFFEFWRKDNVGALNTAESSLHSIRRTAELKMSEQNSQVCINCIVRKQKLCLSAPPEEKTGLKYDRITGQKIRTTSLNLDLESQQANWIELDSDNALAATILKKIESAALKK
jgi:hypothetical protein